MALPPNPSAPPPTACSEPESFASYAARVLTTHADSLRPTTRALYAVHWRRYIAPTLGALPLVAITPARLRDWIHALLGDGYARSTVRVTLELIRVLLRYAVDDDLLPKNPAARVGRDLRARDHAHTIRPVDPQAELLAPPDRTLRACGSVPASDGVATSSATSLNVRTSAVIVTRSGSRGAGTTSSPARRAIETGRPARIVAAAKSTA